MDLHLYMEAISLSFTQSPLICSQGPLYPHPESLAVDPATRHLAPCGFWNSNSHLLASAAMALPTDPSSQPPRLTCSLCASPAVGEQLK